MPFQVLSRTITAPDADGLKTTPVNIRGANGLTVGAVADKAGSKISFRVVCCDGANNVQGVSCPCVLTTGTTTDWGAAYLGTPDQLIWGLPVVPVQGDWAYVVADSVAGTWTLGAAPQYPVGQTQPWS